MQTGFQFATTDEQRFREFHEANPHVYSHLRRLALDLLAKGRKHYGINSLCEVVRWHINLSTTGDEFKINNNLRPWYSRLLMQQEPRLAGFFRTRAAKADGCG